MLQLHALLLDQLHALLLDPKAEASTPAWSRRLP